MNMDVVKYKNSRKKFFRRSIAITLGVLTILALISITVPFISFGKSMNQVVADAAKAYGIEEHEYTIDFSNNLKNKQGSKAYGTYIFTFRGDQVHHLIDIRKTFLRPIMVASIFHEFAHAAQTKYSLDLDELSIEQHAEVLSFSVMRETGYKWDSLHLLPTHMFAKTKEYNVSSQLWNIALTGAGVMSVAQYTQN